MASGGIGAPRGCQGCRYSGSSIGIGGIRWLIGMWGDWGLSGVLGWIGADRECRCSWASRGIGGIRGHWGS